MASTKLASTFGAACFTIAVAPEHLISSIKRCKELGLKPKVTGLNDVGRIMYTVMVPTNNANLNEIEGIFKDKFVLFRGDIVSKDVMGLMCPLPSTVVDLSAPPKQFPPTAVVWHKRQGLWTWDPKRLKLYPKDGSHLTAAQLMDEVKQETAFNANFLDFFSGKDELVCEIWPRSAYGDRIIFPETRYANQRGREGIIRCLVNAGDDFSYMWLGLDESSAHVKTYVLIAA